MTFSRANFTFFFKYSTTPLIRTLVILIANYPDRFVPSGNFVYNSTQVIEGKIKGEMKVARRRGRRRKKLLDDLQDRRGYSHLKEEALDRTMWRHRFGGGFGPVVRQNIE